MMPTCDRVLAHDRRLLKIADVYHEMEEYDLAKVYYLLMHKQSMRIKDRHYLMMRL
ncbi:hypothetical protein [Bacteroides sp. 519]|uniref:hypothetical protein n=1 Tax=Bacteroides sp. 519 TaxID=2302937 RepID=UPI0019402CEA|nr:hypothetical protein [Bacteroides sp. 519]